MLWELLTGGKPWHRDAAGKPYMEGQIMYMVITQAKRPDLPPSVGSPGKARGPSARPLVRAFPPLILRWHLPPMSSLDLSQTYRWSPSKVHHHTERAVSAPPLWQVGLVRQCWSGVSSKRPAFEAIERQLAPLLPKLELQTLQAAQSQELQAAVAQVAVVVDQAKQEVQSSITHSMETIVERIDSAEERLASEVREGNAEVMGQLRLLHGSLLPELQCIISQQTLELSAMRRAEGGGGGASGGMLGWLWGSKEEEEQRLRETQQSVKAAVEMAEAKLRASAAAAASSSSSANASASEAILKRLGEMEAQMAAQASAAAGDAAASEARRSEALLAKLQEMGAYLGQMDGQLSALRLESDERAQEQAKQLSLVHTKLDALLTGSHEQVCRYSSTCLASLHALPLSPSPLTPTRPPSIQVFHFFILIPKPQKGYLGRALDKLKPCHWCNHAAPQASLH